MVLSSTVKDRVTRIWFPYQVSAFFSKIFVSFATFESFVFELLANNPLAPDHHRGRADFSQRFGLTGERVFIQYQ